VQENKKFWIEQAKRYKNNTNAVNFDYNAEELELINIKKLLQDNKVICDMGCGNGKTIFHMLKNGIKSKFYGIDFTREMIENALRQKDILQYKDASFYNISATDSSLKDKFDFQFDTVYSKRLLINLKGKDKYKAIKNIHQILKDDGTYIMVENFIEPLDNINSVRKSLDLERIKVHHFNEYLNKDFLNEISKYFIIQKKIDFNSFYYFISRTFNALLSQTEVPSYDTDINRLAIEISKKNNFSFKGYSPQVIYVLKKRAQ